MRSDSVHRLDVQHLAGLSCERERYASLFHPAYRKKSALTVLNAGVRFE
jgi:hypothetical protein